MSLHARFDLAMASFVPTSARLYADGFGEALDERVRGVRDYPGRPPAIPLSWSRERRVLGCDVREGRFPSPAASYLPLESREGVVEAWLPTPGAPLYLHLAATAEEGFARRRPLAIWLARRGIGSVLLENPFYGARRPKGQRGAVLRTVSDQFAMNLATVEEAAGLLRAFHDAGHEVGVSGYSQGGVMAAFAAAVSDFPVAAVPRAAARGVAPIFTTGALSRAMRWDVLSREAGSLEAARARFAEALDPVRVDRFPPPHDPTRAILVGSAHDGFVPASETEALHLHWAGSELRWVKGGHVTGLVLHHATHRGALLDAIDRRTRS